MENNPTFFQKFMGVINKIGSAIMLNLLFLVSCLPIVTVGPACCGLYSAVRFSIRGDSSFQGFREGFKTRFWRSAIGMIFGVAVTLYSFNHLYSTIAFLIAKPELLGLETVMSGLLHLVFFLAALLLTTAMIPVNLYFKNDLNGWLMDAWRLILFAPLQVLAVGLIWWLPVAVILFFPLYGFFALMIFVAVYYAVMGVVATALLKNGLIRILQTYHQNEE